MISSLVERVFTFQNMVMALLVVIALAAILGFRHARRANLNQSSLEKAVDDAVADLQDATDAYREATQELRGVVTAELRTVDGEFAMLRGKVENALQALRANAPFQQPAIMSQSANYLGPQEPAALAWTPPRQNGQLTAPPPRTLRVLSADRPDQAHPTAVQEPKALTAGVPTTDSYRYAPTPAFDSDDQHPAEVPETASPAAWFGDTPPVTEGGEPHGPQQEEDHVVPPRPVVAEPAVSDVVALGSAGGRDDEPAEKVGAFNGDFTADVTPEVPQAGAGSENRDGATAEPLPNEGVAIDPKALVDDLKALSEDLNGTLGTLRNIPRMADWTPQTVTNMDPISGPDDQTSTE